MNRDETVDLFLKGREAWNAWAEQSLAERKALEVDGRWAAEKDFLGSLEPKNAETRAWMDAARADFSRCLFLVRGGEGIREAAGEAKERKAGAEPPVKSISLDADLIDFSGFVFPSEVNFRSATFTGDANFRIATFTGDANFRIATFAGDTNFRSATFTGDAYFRSATFTGPADFRRATFPGPAYFRSAAFISPAYFQNATFQNSTGFQEAKFGSEALFTGIKVDRAFDMTGAIFARVPAFNQADLKQAPDLDDVTFSLPGFWRGHSAALVAQYRAIRRMAIQGADYEREQMAFKGELRSRRWTVDKWGPALWLGIFYDSVADCGRSIVRPLSIWIASIAVFAAVYLRLSDGWSCGTPFVKALFLSGRNALVLFNGARDARIAQAYQCLFGGNPEPNIPDSVSFLESFVQVPLSATLIFLFLLAVKNRFKIK